MRALVPWDIQRIRRLARSAAEARASFIEKNVVPSVLPRIKLKALTGKVALGLALEEDISRTLRSGPRIRWWRGEEKDEGVWQF